MQSASPRARLIAVTGQRGAGRSDPVASRAVAFEESTRVPFVARGPGIAPASSDTPTSHVDLLPTLLGLAGAGTAELTEDEISRGDIHRGALTNEPFDAVGPPGCVETVIAPHEGGLWKLNRYYDADQRTEEEDWELHDLTSDPHERNNKHRAATAARNALEAVMAAERKAKRLTPAGGSG